MLDYLAMAPSSSADVNVPAALSLAFGLASMAFLMSMCGGVWTRFLPVIAHNAGWITGSLSLLAMICGGVGAFRARKESGWYHVAWIGYAMGILVWAFTPMLFLAR